MKPGLIKVILAGLLLACLLKMPYGYYQFVRFVALIGFVLLAIQANKKGAKIETVVFFALALLFQPFVKIALGRSIWNIVDIIVAIGLLLSVVFFKEYNEVRDRN
ncbi:MAG: hypothetical protein P4L51_04040 [Puia sp.]|nr:hypothetical protein [Puia sp.]